jgi:hypothetical protein
VVSRARKVYAFNQLIGARESFIADFRHRNKLYFN